VAVNLVADCLVSNIVSLLCRLCKLEDTLATVAQLERSMQRLRQWLIEMEHEMSMPLVFQHCDFVEIEKHISRQQVIDIGISPGN